MSKDKIIVPLDVPDLESAIALIDKLPEVTFWKVGLQLFVSSGKEILEILRQRQKRIFLDLKFHDIPNTMAGACRSAMAYKVDFLTIHASAGKQALEATVAALDPASPTQLLAISLLTSLNSRNLAFDLKVPVELPEYTLHLALLAKDAGVNGAVCSPKEVKELRRVCGADFLLVCPGVRPKWSATGDQRRVMTPRETLKEGANYLVIGRPITQADDPSLAFAKICEEIENI